MPNKLSDLMLLALALATAVMVGILTGYVASGGGPDVDPDSERLTLQTELIQAHSELNKSESARAELLATMDFVDDSAYRTGLRDGCAAWGYAGLDCEKEAAEWER